MATKAQKKTETAPQQIKLRQTRSAAGAKPGMKENLIGLGLGKCGAKSVLLGTPAVMGMVRKVRHLIVVEA